MMIVSSLSAMTDPFQIAFMLKKLVPKIKQLSHHRGKEKVGYSVLFAAINR
jgi:hypothetical protein